MSKWLKRSILVGEAPSLDHLGTFHLYKKLGVSTKYLGGLFLALEFGFSKDADDYLADNAQWKDWCKCLKVGDGEELRQRSPANTQTNNVVCAINTSGSGVMLDGEDARMGGSEVKEANMAINPPTVSSDNVENVHADKGGSNGLHENRVIGRNVNGPKSHNKFTKTVSPQDDRLKDKSYKESANSPFIFTSDSSKSTEGKSKRRRIRNGSRLPQSASLDQLCGQSFDRISSESPCPQSCERQSNSVDSDELQATKEVRIEIGFQFEKVEDEIVQVLASGGGVVQNEG
ncbi:hypothetical protein L1887_14928 [Cichorium endivia]|nr:hypothetical protein L1887_14928 [Cichorium endivia]